MSVKRKSKEPTTITIAEFKQWLSGVEDMQPDGWVPNAEQWKKIRAKIASVAESFEEAEDVPLTRTAPVSEPHYQQYNQPVVHHPQYTPAPQRPYIPASSLGDELFIPSASNADHAFDQGLAPGATQFS